MALALTVSTAFGQKGISYKIDRVGSQVPYTHLPAVLESETYENYSLAVKTSTGSFVDLSKYLTLDPIKGKSKINVSKQMTVELIGTSISYGTNEENHTDAVKDATGKVVSPAKYSYDIPYTIVYKALVKYVADGKVLIDSVFTAKGSFKYPQALGGAEPSSEAKLKEMWDKDMSNDAAGFEAKKENASWINALANDIQKKLTAKVGKQKEFLILTFNIVKTKDPEFAELTTAGESLTEILKTFRKNETPINFHVASLTQQIKPLIPIFEKFGQEDYINKFTEEKEREEYRWKTKANLISLYFLTNQYEKAINVMDELAKAVQEQRKKETSQVNEANTNIGLKVNMAKANLSTLPAEKAYFSVESVIKALIEELDNYDAKKAFYNYEI